MSAAMSGVPAPILAHFTSCGAQCAPLSVQEVVQVTVLPWSHDLQALTHWFMSRGLKELKFRIWQIGVEPVTSCSWLQAAVMSAKMMTATRRMGPHCEPLTKRHSRRPLHRNEPPAFPA